MKAKNKAPFSQLQSEKGNQKNPKITARPATGKPGAMFWHFVVQKENRVFAYAALLIGIVYFIALRLLFPIPSFYSDSYTYIQVARDNQPVSFRPGEYAEMINFFKGMSTSYFRW